ncbi:MAG: hypothetical protein OEZ57_05180 [Nitrospirota bacterium]|nr:hypothetical protein [Nitrospirota bacterium]MDH5586171.1 hypothetical protein [Nitrospirota bacterium]MDH5774291.1 hypothetical protein [Nitrospirota bacterium]
MKLLRLKTFMVVPLLILLMAPALAWADMDDHAHQGKHGHSAMVAPGQWEGSREGIAYSEFNHALTGVGVIIVGMIELGMAMGWRVWRWSQRLLPAALLGSGIFLLIWSDHEAWPIGSWTLAETLSGKDSEMLQHKIFGVLALGVGTVEWLRRVGKLEQWFWSSLLPGFALIGGGMLFLHMHGPHPAGHQIQMHHYVMGTLALAGGMAWFGGEWLNRSTRGLSQDPPSKSVLKIIWAVLVIIIGVQLLFYSES